jgi:hypothetical protein
MYLIAFIVMLVLTLSISGVYGTIVATNSVTTAAGSLSYSIDYFKMNTPQLAAGCAF